MTHFKVLPALLSPIKELKPIKKEKSLRKKVLKLCKRKLKGLHRDDIFSAKHVLIRNTLKVVKKQDFLVEMFPGVSEGDLKNYSPDFIDNRDLLQGFDFPGESVDDTSTHRRNSPGHTESLLHDVDLDQVKSSDAHSIPVHVSTLDEQAAENGCIPSDTLDEFKKCSLVSGNDESSPKPISVLVSSMIEEAELNKRSPSDVLEEFHNSEIFGQNGQAFSEEREFDSYWGMTL